MISKVIENMQRNGRMIEKLACKRKLKLKNNPTKTESIIRTFLLKNQIPHNFQKIIYTENRFFIVDFLIYMKPRLIIEIDGNSHIGKESYDKDRELRILDRKNFKKRKKGMFGFLRINNENVLNGKAIELLKKIYYKKFNKVSELSKTVY